MRIDINWKEYKSLYIIGIIVVLLYCSLFIKKIERLIVERPKPEAPVERPKPVEKPKPEKTMEEQLKEIKAYLEELKKRSEEKKAGKPCDIE